MISRTKRFSRGGIHPRGYKELSNQKAIEVFPTSKLFTVSLSQHIGATAKAIVSVGQHVEVGERIGEATSFVSAHVHSPVSGTVKDIVLVELPVGLTCDAIVIETDEEQPNCYENEVNDLSGLSKEMILEKIRAAGIVGAGGATFPTHVKLTIAPDKKAKFIIINGVECEPYLNADNRLMIEHPNEIIKGIAILQKLIEVDELYIGIEKNKPLAIKAINEAAKALNFPLKVVPLKIKYPQGDEKQLVEAITKIEIPVLSLPIDIGAVVVNVGSVFAIYEAVLKDKPFIQRVVSVSGLGVKRASNFLVKIGTPYKELIERAAGINDETVKFISGGPMMGFSFYDCENSFVGKGTSGILFLTDKEIKQKPQTNCLNCGCCLRVCPMGLHPTKMFRNFMQENFGKMLSLGLMDCKECGCCSYSCPAAIPLVHSFKMAKREARKIEV